MQHLVPENKPAAVVMDELNRWLARNKSHPPTGNALSSDTCQRCGGTGYEPIEQHGVRVVNECECQIERDIKCKLAKIAPRDRWARIETLEPCFDTSKCFAPVELQRRVIRLLEQEPDGSYAFFGATGTGKTTYLAALYRHAVESQRRGCFYTRMADLVRELRDIECGREITPYLSREILRHTIELGLKPRVFLDECDKLKPTEFSVHALHEIFDEIYRLCEQHSPAVQLVVATNLNRDEFCQNWGANVLRRIEAVCEVIDYFDQPTLQRERLAAKTT